MADVQRQAGRPPGRPRPGDPFMQEVRWRLFRRQDIPARLRRLERLEDVALSDRTAEAPPAAGAEEQAPG